MPPVLPSVPSHRLPISPRKPPQRVHKEVSTSKPWSDTPSVQNKSTPKTKEKTKKSTPYNDSLQHPFSSRILQSVSHQYDTHFRSRVADNLVAQHLFQFQINYIYNHKLKRRLSSHSSLAYCSWFQVEITSTWNPHTPCMHGKVNTETYPRIDSGRQHGSHKLTT